MSRGHVAPPPRDVTTQEELPSAPWYVIIAYRYQVGVAETKYIYLVACSEAQLDWYRNHEQLNQWYVIKYHPGKPTLNPRKRYTLKSHYDFFGKNFPV